RGALTYFTPRPILLLEGMLLVLLLGLTLVGILAGEFWAFFHVGGWTILLLLVYILSLYMLHRYEGNERWRPIGEPEEGDPPQPEVDQRPVQDVPPTPFHTWNLQRQALFFALNGAVILV